MRIQSDMKENFKNEDNIKPKNKKTILVDCDICRHWTSESKNL